MIIEIDSETKFEIDFTLCSSGIERSNSKLDLELAMVRSFAFSVKNSRHLTSFEWRDDMMNQ